MLPRRKAKVAFAIAFGLLLLNGAAAVFATLRFSNNANLIARTFEIESATRRVESRMIDAARARYSYVQTGDSTDLQQYRAAVTDISAATAHVRQLTSDNPAQQQLCTQLEAVTSKRISILDASMDLRQSGENDAAKQAALTNEGLASANALAEVTERMIANEQQLLPPRVQGSQQLFILIMAVQAAMFAVPIALFGIQYVLLNKALQERETAESNARHLSGRVLQLQDEERRKFARELHDGLGQSLCVAKIAASKANESYPTDANVAEIDRILEQSLNETRTISYLLHPPLLDEMGFASAAKWYVEGFAQRSGIEVSIHMAKEMDRLPREIELALFRILQESLINIHKHAKSPRADVSLNISGDEVILRIRDYGQGIAGDRLARFQSNGSQFGLGLAGMRERVREHNGRFEIQSNAAGTTITVRMPRGILEATEQKTLHPAVQS